MQRRPYSHLRRTIKQSIILREREQRDEKDFENMSPIELQRYIREHPDDKRIIEYINTRPTQEIHPAHPHLRIYTE